MTLAPGVKLISEFVVVAPGGAVVRQSIVHSATEGVA